MEEYNYRGYPIGYNTAGNYEIDFDDCVMEFVSYDEATEWIDSYLEKHPKPVLHTYHIFYVTEDYIQGYDDYITAYNENDAIAQLKQLNPDLEYITDCYQIDD